MNRSFSIIAMTALALMFIVPFANSLAASRVLWVDSYHKGYQWSDDIEKGLRRALGINSPDDDTAGSPREPVVLKIFRMDTKRNHSEAFKRNTAFDAMVIIDRWLPDVVVASDDNAAKYLISPFFKNGEMPIVFCGVNWDAAVYGFPAPNITGMIEVDPLIALIARLKKYAQGDRVGYIGADNLSNRKKLPYHDRILGVRYTDGALAADFEQWKREYQRLQNTVDILIVFNFVGLSGWDNGSARQVVFDDTRIPSGSMNKAASPLALMGVVKIGEEQGWWAGKTVLKILAGASPADIPLATNKNSSLFLNMPLAARMGIKFPVDLIQKATLVLEPLEGE